MNEHLNDQERREQGMRIRREVLGDAHVDRAVAATTSFTADFQDFITRTAWGDLWQRPGLSRQERSMLTLAITSNAGTAESYGGEAALAYAITDELNVNLSGASLDDVNMSGWRVNYVNLSGLRLTKANLAGASISESRYDGMTIDGVAVTDMIAAYKAAQIPANQVPRTEA